MSELPPPPAPADLVLRPYGEPDYLACRALWVELTEEHRRLYEDPTIGGDDPGDGLDAYLATPERVASWVAEVAGHVVGLTGLFDHGTSGEIEPVVVAASHRGRGIGRKLIAQVVDEARHRGYDYVAVRPVARNVAAIRHFHAAGFVNLGGHLDLTLDLARRRHTWRPGVRLHERDFGY